MGALYCFLNLYLFSCIYCYFQGKKAEVRSYCRECGVFLCLRSGHNCFRLYHSRTNKVALNCREFAVTKNASKPGFVFCGGGWWRYIA